MKIVFFGTPASAAHILQFVIEKHVSIAAIVTQPDRPQGRKLQLAPSAVKVTARALAPDVPLLQPEKCSHPDFLAELASCGASLYVVVAFGQILPQKLLDIPPLGCINIHFSLLPKYRGAAPIQRCLMNGDSESGVSIQKMIYQLDAGDVVREERLAVPLEMTHGELQDKLCELSKPLLLSLLAEYQTGHLPPATAQNHAAATLAPKIKPPECEIRWNQSAIVLHNRIRALSPRPGAWCWIEQNGEKKRLKILRSKISAEQGSPGQLLAFAANNCLVAAEEQSLQLLEVQPEGKKIMTAAEWIRGCAAPPLFSL